MGGGDAVETVKLLGGRLRDVLAEAEVGREKVRMLEGIVQSQQSALEDKKRLLKELTASSGGSSSTSTEQTVNAAGDSVAVLRTILSKALSENERLKRDLRVLGQELAGCEERLRAAQAAVAEHEARAAVAAEAAAAAAASPSLGGGEQEEEDDET